MQRPTGCRLTPNDVEYVNSEYGKNAVRILYIRREGKTHCIKELEVSVHIRLNTVNEFLHADNCQVIPTDTIKNTIEALAKCRGIRTIEEFGLDICEHFITQFCHVVYVNAFIQEVPWQRLEKDGCPHVHAFLHSSEGVRFCEVERTQTNSPCIFSGIKDLKLMKTTQSGFQGFFKDKYTTLPERSDRVLSVEILIKWCYGDCLENLEYDCIWRTAHEAALDAFAGPPDTGHFSPSYQKTVNCIQTYILDRIPQIEEVEVIVSNIHYSVTPLEKLGLCNDKELARRHSHSMLAIVQKGIENKMASAVMPLCKSMVRPDLEDCVHFWCSHPKKDTVEMEKVQKRATEMIKVLTPQDSPFGASASTLRRKRSEGTELQIPECKPRYSVGWKSGRGMK